MREIILDTDIGSDIDDAFALVLAARCKQIKLLGVTTLYRNADLRARLARLLLEDCTHLQLFVGTAINPAHQNPNLPMDLSIKMRLLNELADVMRKMGRRVEVNFY